MSSRFPDDRAADFLRRAATIGPRAMILLATTGLLAWEAASPGAPLRSAASIGDLAQHLVGVGDASGHARAPASLAGGGRRVLRVAADPNNYPFSDDKRRGFENRIAELVAKDLGLELRWVWRAQRRGFFRETLQQGNADLVTGVPVGFERALTTRPYYRSTYVFVTRRDRRLRIRSLDDPALRRLRIGVQLIGDDGANTPPAHSLGIRGLGDRVVGFTVYGDPRSFPPQARILDAVVRRNVDVAAVWGPLAGSYARRSRVPLEITPIPPDPRLPAQPFAFEIGMGVRKGDVELRDAVDRAIARERGAIEGILDEYGVPRLGPES